ncbi:putative glycerol-3-phosphate transporter 5 [Aplysia californica]|uniref:Glycerol-3-phosphate transporter 5 n=1 Tax=Aplysia californica TaxID=6500 RepID=A0ABM0JPW9_APLCA|nr:putative glycerol-3-phosphate transporter 5 [Aplysia californica]
MSSLRFHQIKAFALGWLAYASTYFLRKPLGVIKADLQRDLSFSTSQLGFLDTALLLPYAVMQMILGPLGDKFGARKTFGFCLVLSGMSMVFFGNFSNFFVFFALLFLNGTAQSQCWPNCTKGLLCWFSDSVRNSVFGMFGTCAFAGGIMGTMIAVYVQANQGWQNVYFWPSIFVMVMGVLVLMMFQQPDEVQAEVPGKNSASPTKGTAADDSMEKPRMIDLWRLPMIPEVSFAVFCIKVVRYCMYMWLPMFLLQSLNYSQSMAGIFSTVFEIGGVTGSALIGFALDKFYQGQTLRGITMFVLISTLGLVFFILTSSWGVLFNSVFLFIAGAFNAGPDILLCGTVPTELVEKHNKNAAVATVGLVNGFGSIGTCIEGPIIGFVAAYTGWSGMFYLMIILSAMGTLSTYRAASIHARVNQSAADFIGNIA